jgi:hypothetical protein
MLNFSELETKWFYFNIILARAGHVERYQLQSYRFKHFFVTL